MSEDTLSCGIVLVRSSSDGYRTLLLRAYHHWDFPKGLLEEGEEPLLQTVPAITPRDCVSRRS